MTVDVLIFGMAAERAGADRVRVTVPEGSGAQGVLAALVEQHPVLGFAAAGARLAVNSVFAGERTEVRAGDEVALISLVGGG